MRQPGLYTPAALRPVQFFNTIAQRDTDQVSDVYMEQVAPGQTVTVDGQAYTAKADPTGANISITDGGTYHETGFAYFENTNPTKILGLFLPATKWVLSSVPGMMQMLEDDLREQKARVIDWEALNGTGTSNRMTGLLQMTGIKEQAKDPDEPIEVALGRAINYIEVDGRSMPDMIYLHPTDWWNAIFQQDALGRFLMFGSERPTWRLAGIPIEKCEGLSPVVWRKHAGNRPDNGPPLDAHSRPPGRAALLDGAGRDEHELRPPHGAAHGCRRLPDDDHLPPEGQRLQANGNQLGAAHGRRKN